MKILVVDDDRDQLSLRSMLIERSGFETMEASDGASAMELAAARKPACAVLDLRLPTEDAGLQLIRDLKNLDAAMHLIVLTGGDPQRLGRHPEVKLVDELMTKPASSADLIARLRNFEASA
jgi:DNA-binding response OmpR family regulator